MTFRRAAGFTAIELMITVAIIAVLLGIAAPSLRDLILNARMTGLANNLMTDLAIARSEAVKRGSRTAICPSTTAAQCAAPPFTNCRCTNTAWNQGYLILQDADSDGVVTAATDFIKYVPAIDGANDGSPNTIVSNAAGTPQTVTFLASGVSTQGGAGSTTFALCDSRAQAYGAASNVASGKGRLITLSGTGRAISSRCTCNGNTPPTCP